MNWGAYLSRRVTAAILCVFLAIILKMFHSNLLYEMLLVDLAEIIITWSIAYFIRTQSEYDRLFRYLGLYVNDSYPLFYNVNNNVYRFLLPIGLSTQDFEKKKDAIQQYRGRSIDIDYEYDKNIKQGIVVINETGNIGKSASRNNSSNKYVYLIVILIVIITDILMVKVF